jgi:hypothetical protein
MDETHSKQRKSIGKSMPAHGFLKSREKNPRPKGEILPNVRDFQTEKWVWI